MTTTTTATVTREQLDRCTRIVDEATMTPFYLVRSESNDQVEYKVSAICKEGRFHLVCTCPAGLEGKTCKHRRWATAAAAEYKALLKEQAQAASKAHAETHSLIVDGTVVSAEYFATLNARKPAPRGNAKPVSSKPFSLLK